MIKSLSALCFSWCFRFRKHSCYFACYKSALTIIPLASPGCTFTPVISNTALAAIKIFICDFALVITINSICKISFEIVEIKKFRTGTNFFIGCKAYPYITMGNIFFYNFFNCGDNFCNTGLIICAEKGSTICCYECAAF